MPTIRLIVYDPPQDGYPFLAVALSPTREVSAVAYDTRQEAEAHNAALATEAAKAMRFQKKSKITDTRWRYISCTTISFASMTLRTTPAMAAGVTKRLWEI